MLNLSDAIPKYLKAPHSALWLIASEFHCGSTITARFFLPGFTFFGFGGNQRAFTRLFSGYGVFTGDVKRRNSACETFLSFGAGPEPVWKRSTLRFSNRKSVGTS